MRFISFVCIVFPFCLFGQFTYTWILEGNGNWNDSANWSSTPGDFPNEAGDTASFSGTTASSITVTLGQDIIIKDTFFSSPTAFTIGTTSTETLTYGDTLPFILLGGGQSQPVTFACPIVLSGSTVRMIDNTSFTFTLSGVISGPGELVADGDGSGFLVLSNTNTYSGGTSLISGFIQAGATNVFGTGPVAVSDGTNDVDLAGFSQSFGELSGNGTISSSTGSPTLTTNVTDTPTFNGTIEDAIALVLTGSGTLILTGGVNTYTGGTTVSGGTLQGNTGSLQGAITNNSAVVFDQSFDDTYAGLMTGSGSLTLQNVGTLTLTAANTYSGGTIVNGGTLQAGIANAFGSGSMTVNAALDLNGFDQSVGSLSGSSDGTITSSTTGATLMTATTGSSTFAGVISGPIALTMDGTGTLILTGTNTYSDGTLVSSGTLQGDSNSLQGAITNNAAVDFDQDFLGTYSGVMMGSGTLTKQGTGTLILTGANIYSGGTTVSLGILQGNTTSLQGAITDNAVVVFDQSSTGTYAGVMNGSGSLTKQNTGTLILTGANTYMGGTLVTGGILQGNTTSLQGDITNNAQVVFDQSTTGTYAGLMSGTGSLTKQNVGILTLSSANTYLGGTTITGGTLRAGVVNAFGSGAMSDNAILDLNGFSQVVGTLSGTGEITSSFPAIFTTNMSGTSTFSGPIVQSIGLTVVGSGTLILSGANTYTLGTVVGEGTLQAGATNVFGTGSMEVDGLLNLNGFDQSVGALSGNGNIQSAASATLTTTTSGSTTFSGDISEALALTVDGTGKLILTGTNTYTGGTLVSSGTLQGDTDSLQGDILNQSFLVFDQSFDDTFSGAISGTGSLTKQNSGTLTLIGTNAQSGGMNITGGGVLVNGNFNGPVSVEGGALLGGTGTITGNVNNMGTIAPGASIGTLNVVGDVVFASGSTFEVEFNCSAADALNATGSVTIASGTTIDLVPLPPLCMQNVFTIITADGGLSGKFTTISSLPPLILVELVYEPTQLLLLLEYGPFVILSCTGNAGSVAAYLDEQTVASTSDLANILTILRFTMDPADICMDLLQFQSSFYSGFTLMHENLALQVNAFYNTRTAECPGMWYGLLGDFVKQGKVKDYIMNGYRSTSEGFVVGWDKACTPCNVFGASASFVQSGINWGPSVAYGNEWDLFLSLYGSGTHFDASILGGYGYATASREIQFEDVNRTASHHHYSWIWDVHLGLQWPFCDKDVVLSPFAEFDLMNEYQSSYKETGAMDLNLQVQRKHAKLLRSEIGVDLLVCGGFNVALGYVYEKRPLGKYITAKMQGAEGYFTVTGLNPNRSLLAYDLSLQFQRQIFHFDLGYGGEIGNRFRDQHISLKVKGSF